MCALHMPKLAVIAVKLENITQRRQIVSSENNAKAYWSATLGLLTKVLVIWFLVSYGAGILFASVLNTIHIGGYPVGFWFSQQGSIYVFIALIFWYAKKMGEIDRRFGMQED
jgi:putative solute:sodium symporter small subunit